MANLFFKNVFHRELNCIRVKALPRKQKSPRLGSRDSEHPTLTPIIFKNRFLLLLYNPEYSVMVSSLPLPVDLRV